MAPDIGDPIREARARAENALRSFTWQTHATVVGSWLAGTVGVTGVLATMVAAGMVSVALAWQLLLVLGLWSAVLLFAFLYVGRLHERSEALRDLMSVNRQYDILLRTAWEERDQANDRSKQVQMERDVLRGLLTREMLESKREEDR